MYGKLFLLSGVLMLCSTLMQARAACMSMDPLSLF